jgi:hypothetical protein
MRQASADPPVSSAEQSADPPEDRDIVKLVRGKFFSQPHYNKEIFISNGLLSIIS